MDYKLALRNLFEMVEIVLYCIFTIIYTLASLTQLISTLCVNKMGHTKSHHTIDIEFFGHKYTLSTKK